MKRVLLGTVASLLIIAGLVLLLAMRGLDLSFARGTVATLASEMIGREVQLDGDLHFKLGTDSRLTLSALRIANSESAGPEPLLALSSFIVELQTISLLRGVPYIRLLQVDGLQLHIREFSDGTTNLPKIFASEETELKPANEDTARLPLILESIQVTEVVAHFQKERTQQALRFSIEELSQTLQHGAGLELHAEGFLDEEPWTLSGQFSDLNTLITGKNIHHTFTAQAAGLTLQAQGSFPELANPKDWKLGFSLAGKISNSLSVLSPLMSPGAHLDARVSIDDIDPGISWLADISLDDIALTLTGKADNPLKLDGAIITLDARGGNLASLASAAGLGDLPPRAFSASGTLVRQGTQLEIKKLVLLSGPDRLRLDGQFRHFPLTRDAELTLQASGPDFSIYQRLLQLPVTLEAPYTFSAQLIDQTRGLELATSELQLGDHLATIKGPVGDYPSYEGTDLDFTISGPSLAQLSSVFGLSGPPPKPYKATGRALVQAQGNVTVRDFRADVGAISAFVSGNVGPLPDPKSLDFKVALEAVSLAELGNTLGIAGLAAQPVRLQARAFGKFNELELGDIALRVADATVATQGSIMLTDAGPEGKLKADIHIPNLPKILGDRSPAGLATGPYTAVVDARITQGVATADDAELTGPGLKGTFAGRSGPELSIAGASLNAALNFLSPVSLLPSVGDYKLPSEPLLLRLTANTSAAGTSITGSLRGKASALNLTALLPGEDASPVPITLSGKGIDLAAFGHYSDLPMSGVPYNIDVNATMQANTYRATIEQLIVGDTQISGDLTLQTGDVSRLQATLQIPHADIGYWQAKEAVTKEPDTNAAPPTSTTAEKIIPDIPIPTQFLKQYAGHVSIRTGKLGVPDPFFVQESLVNSMIIDARLEEQILAINLSELTGSRGHLRANMQMALVGGLPTASLELTATDFPLGITASADALQKLPLHSLDAQFSGAGKTLATILASLNGSLALLGGPGLVDDVGLNMAMGSFTNQLLEVLIPSINAEPDVEVECTVLAIKAHEGVLTLDPGFMMRTARMDMAAKGTIDLETEKIRVRFSNKARKGLGISASGLINPYIQIVGTLAKPRVGIDPKGAAISGTAAVATGGLSILGENLFNRFLNQDQPCARARESIQAARSAPSGS